MSDNWITLIPESPRFVPEAKRVERARARLAEIAPDADEIEVELSDEVRFIDCGGNFECVRCPTCRAEIPTDWWSDRMDEEFAGGCMLRDVAMPCCGAHHSLDSLVYEWPQGFARFSLSAMNPRIGRLDDRSVAGFEDILGTRLRVIYQHI